MEQIFHSFMTSLYLLLFFGSILLVVFLKSVFNKLVYKGRMVMGEKVFNRPLFVEIFIGIFWILIATLIGYFCIDKPWYYWIIDFIFIGRYLVIAFLIFKTRNCEIRVSPLGITIKDDGNITNSYKQLNSVEFWTSERDKFMTLKCKTDAEKKIIINYSEMGLACYHAALIKEIKTQFGSEYVITELTFLDKILKKKKFVFYGLIVSWFIFFIVSLIKSL